MQYRYPTPSEAGVDIPPVVHEKLFNEGFRYGLEGGSLDKPACMRFSFRMGVRAAKFYLRQVRRSQGIIEFPQCWKFRIRACYTPPTGQKRALTPY